MDRRKRLTEVLLAMKEKAENAYLNGEIATARHLATVALENLPDDASIDEAAWCYAILLHCFKNDTDYYNLSNRFFDRKQPGMRRLRFEVEESTCGQLITFLMELLKPSISPHMMERWQTTFLTMDSAQVPDDISSALLMETVIELACYFGMEKWEEVGTRFGKELAKHNGYVTQVVSQCVRRLSFQIGLIRSQDNTGKTFYSPQFPERLLAHAWKLYFCSDFHSLNKLIPDLSNAIGCGSEYFLSVQGIITATEWPRNIATQCHEVKGKEHKLYNIGADDALSYTEDGDSLTEKRKDPFYHGKYYRYQRFETERPLAAFLTLRENGAQKIALQLREKSLMGDSYSTQCWELFRTLPFLWSSALKYWDLLSLLQVYEMEMEFHWGSAVYFEHGQYKGVACEALDAIRCAILSARSDPYKRPDAHKLIGVIEKYGSEEDVRDLYRFILNSAPRVTWKLCVEWLRLLGDLLPEELLDMLLDWTGRYHEHEDELVTSINTKEYNYLEPIVRHYPLTDTQLENINFYFEKKLRFPPDSIDEVYTLLYCLAERSLPCCQRMMRMMLEWPEVPYVRTIIINCCARLAKQMPDVKEFCVELLRQREEKNQCAQYGRFADIISDPESAEKPDLQAVRSSIQTTLDSIDPHSYNSQKFNSIYDEVDGRNWSAVSTQELNEFVELFRPVFSGQKEMNSMYYIDVLRLLWAIARTAARDVKSTLADILLCEGNVFTQDVFPDTSESNVWSNYRIEFFRPEHLHNEVLLILCETYDAMTVPQKRKALRIASEKLNIYPEQVYYPTYLFLRSCADDEMLRSEAQMGLVQLRLLAVTAKDKGNAVLQEILKGIASAQQLGGDSIKNSLVKQFSAETVSVGAKSIFYQDRLSAAELINKNADLQSKLGDVLKELQCDKRKSVRDMVT